MHSLLTFVLVAVLATCALAAPTPNKALVKRTFSYSVKPRRAIIRTPRQELVRTYNKFGWQIVLWNPTDSPFGNLFGGDSTPDSSPAAPASTPAAAGSSDTASTAAAAAPAADGGATGGASSSGGKSGEVAATPEQGESEYLEKVTVGGQSLNLDFDTGSADLWVFTSELPASQSQGHSVFNPDQSSTWTPMQGGSWKIAYGDGSGASGSVGYDQVTIGGVTAAKQAVELATSVSGSFIQDTNNDGLVGLAFGTINTIEPRAQATFFENVMQQLDQPVFTARLRHNAPGTYTFGTIDKSEYTGDIHYTPINTEHGFWQFESPTYSIGGQTRQCTTCSAAIADTGTSLMLLDADIVKAYYAQVDGATNSPFQGGYTYPCDTTLPDLGVAVGTGYTATIKGADLTYAEIGRGKCFGGLQSNAGQGIQILGDVFLKQFLAVFDGGNNQFGIAAGA